MAEYNEVIKQFKRMCWYYSRDKVQKSCPMCASYPNCNIGQCRKIAFEKPAHLAATVMRWAAEHPEPKYPTWVEWLMKCGVLMPTMDTDIVFSEDGKHLVTGVRFTLKAYEPIPADIAEKLGIEPKE